MIRLRTHTLTIPMMANVSMTTAFRGGKVSPDTAATSSAERPPTLIACSSLSPAGFNPVVFILLVLLVPIVVFTIMMMVVDNRNRERQLIATLHGLWSCEYKLYRLLYHGTVTREWLYLGLLSTIS